MRYTVKRSERDFLKRSKIVSEFVEVHDRYGNVAATVFGETEKEARARAVIVANGLNTYDFAPLFYDQD